jgi:hypothetical protein
MKLHLNWGACGDWHDARERLRFLNATLYGNFADIEGDGERIKAQIVRRGFKVECESRGEVMTLRISDASK